MVWSTKNPLSVMVVLSEKNNHMADPNCKSLHLVFQHKTGSHGKYTKYLCYDCSQKTLAKLTLGRTITGPRGC